jgi:DNA-directed RNA polymerase specialized sigma24 family protein
MPARLTKAPETTVFSVNPATGEPYMTQDQAQALAYKHLTLHASNLTQRLDIEDLKQELMLKLSMSSYDPAKSAAVTFAITCFNSRCGQIWNATVISHDRWREVSDFEVFEKNTVSEEYVWATEVLAVDDITPEDYASHREVIAEVARTNSGLAADKQITKPKGWRSYPPSRDPYKKRPRES